MRQSDHVTTEIKVGIDKVKKLITSLKSKGSFIQNVSFNSLGYIVLFGSQLLFTPLISRLYSPEKYGLFSTILALSTNVATILSLRMENILYVEESDQKRKGIIGFICGSSFVIGGVLFCLALFVHSYNLLDIELFKSPYFLFFPLLMFLQVMHLFSGTELTRQKKFKENLVWGIPSTILSKVYSLVHGYLLNGNVLGLIASEIILRLSYVGFQIKLVLKESVGSYLMLNKRSIKDGVELLKEYKRFPLYELPITYFNIVTSQAHIYALSFINQNYIIGLIGMAFTVLDVPTRLLGYSIQPVLIQKTSEFIGKGLDISSMLNKVVAFFSFIAFIPFLIILLIGPEIFKVALGANWLVAGQLASAFSIFYFYKMEVEMFDGVLTVLKLQKFKLKSSLFNNVLRVVSLVVMIILIEDPLTAIIYWSIVNAFVMLLTLCWIYQKLSLNISILFSMKVILFIVLIAKYLI